MKIKPCCLSKQLDSLTENPFVFCGYKVSHVIVQNTHSRNIFSVHGFLNLSVRHCYTRQFFLQLVRQFCCAVARQVALNVGECPSMQRWKNSLQHCQDRCEKYNRLLILATIVATKKVRDMFISGYVTLGNFSCNLFHKKL